MADLMRARHNVTGGVAELPDTDFWRDLGWLPVDDDTPTTDETRALFNPADYNVDEVTAYLERADDTERARVLAAEKAGEARKTVLEWSA